MKVIYWFLKNLKFPVALVCVFLSVQSLEAQQSKLTLVTEKDLGKEQAAKTGNVPDGEKKDNTGQNRENNPDQVIDNNSPKENKTDEGKPKLKLDPGTTKPKSVSGLRDASAPPDFVVPIGCTTYFYIQGGPSQYAYQTVNVLTYQSPINTMAMSMSTPIIEPYNYSVNVPIQLDGNGFGVSNPVYVRGLTLGQNNIVLDAPSGFFQANTLYFAVVECQCPVITVNTLPRN